MMAEKSLSFPLVNLLDHNAHSRSLELQLCGHSIWCCTRCTGFLIGLSVCCITILLLGDPYRFGSGSTASGLEAGFFLSFLGLFHYFKGWKNSSFGSNFGRFFFGIASGLGAPLVILSEPNTIMRGIALVGVMTVLLLIYVFGLLFQQN